MDAGLTALGYIGVRSTKLDDWNAYATRLLGMQPVDQGGAVRAFRMDDRKQRLVILVHVQNHVTARKRVPQVERRQAHRVH